MSNPTATTISEPAATAVVVVSFACVSTCTGVICTLGILFPAYAAVPRLYGVPSAIHMSSSLPHAWGRAGGEGPPQAGPAIAGEGPGVRARYPVSPCSRARQRVPKTTSPVYHLIRQ